LLASGICSTFFSAFGLMVRGVFAFGISLNSLMSRQVVFGPHIDATTQRLITSLVAGDVFILSPSGCGIVNLRHKKFLFVPKKICMYSE
jgi:hypothetical protein